MIDQVRSCRRWDPLFQVCPWAGFSSTYLAVQVLFWLASATWVWLKTTRCSPSNKQPSGTIRSGTMQYRLTPKTNLIRSHYILKKQGEWGTGVTGVESGGIWFVRWVTQCACQANEVSDLESASLQQLGLSLCPHRSIFPLSVTCWPLCVKWLAGNVNSAA